MIKMMKQSRTSTAPEKCIVTHYVKCLLEDWNEPVKQQPKKNRCVWNLEREG